MNTISEFLLHVSLKSSLQYKILVLRQMLQTRPHPRQYDCTEMKKPYYTVYSIINYCIKRSM
jgi:hypothetical protein